MTRSPPEILTVGEAADRLKVHPQTLYRWIDDGLPHLRVGRGKSRAAIRLDYGLVLTWCRERAMEPKEEKL